MRNVNEAKPTANLAQNITKQVHPRLHSQSKMLKLVIKGIWFNGLVKHKINHMTTRFGKHNYIHIKCIQN